MDIRHNKEKIFEDLVAVVSTCEKPAKENKKRDLMVYISFNEATFGGNPENEVSFKLKLRKAEFLIVVGDETLQIDGDSILKTNPSDDREIEEKGGQSSQESIGGGLSAGTNTSISMKAGNAKSSEKVITQRYKAGRINYTFHPAHKQLLWLLEPYLNEPHLKGSVWGNSKKVLTLIDKRTKPEHVLSSINLIIRCKREDLDPTALKYLSNGILNSFCSEERSQKRKEALAMEMIKDALVEQGLEDKEKDISHDYTTIKLADILVEVE